MTKIDKAIKSVLDDIVKGREAEWELGPAIRVWREAKSIAQQDLAVELEISAGFLCDVELGRRTVSKSVLDKLRQVVGNKL